MKKQKNRNAFLLIVGFLILAALLTSVFFMVRNAFKEEETSSSSSSSSSSTPSEEPSDDPITDEDPPEGSEGGDVDEEIETDEAALAASGIRMETYALGAKSFSLNDLETDKTSLLPKLGFWFYLSDIAKREIDALYDMQVLIAEKTSFEALNEKGADYVDWLPLFKQSNFTYFLRDVTEFTAEGEGWLVKSWTDPLSLKSVDTEYYAVAIVNTGDGYQYTTFEGYDEGARSVTYAASRALAENSVARLLGHTQFDGVAESYFKYYISKSANMALGYDDIKISGLTYNFNDEESATINLSVGKTYTINYSMSPTPPRLGYMFIATDSMVAGSAKEDDSVVTVSEDGVITAKAPGTAYVYVLGGGDGMLRMVKVS